MRQASAMGIVFAFQTNIRIITIIIVIVILVMVAVVVTVVVVLIVVCPQLRLFVQRSPKGTAKHPAEDRVVRPWLTFGMI